MQVRLSNSRSSSPNVAICFSSIQKLIQNAKLKTRIVFSLLLIEIQIYFSKFRAYITSTITRKKYIKQQDSNDSKTIQLIIINLNVDFFVLFFSLVFKVKIHLSDTFKSCHVESDGNFCYCCCEEQSRKNYYFMVIFQKVQKGLYCLMFVYRPHTHTHTHAKRYR